MKNEGLARSPSFHRTLQNYNKFLRYKHISGIYFYNHI